MEHTKRSLRGQMTFIILLCWLLPMLLAAGALGGYLAFGLGRQSRRAAAEQFQLNLQMGADRVESAVEASRLPSYDPELREAWSQYRQEGNYALLYRRCSALFTRLYQSDSRFRYAVFCFSDDPEDRAITVVNGSSGSSERQARERWRGDLPAVAELAAGLDTAVGFLERDGQVYLVRNLVDSGYRTIGVLSLALNQSYYFEDLSLLSWASAVSVELEPDSILTVKGEAPPRNGDGVLEAVVNKRDFVLRGRAAVDYQVLLAGFEAYRYVLGAMALSLLLLLLFTFRFFRRKISRPIQALMAGAADIQEGQWGRRIECETGSREFEYLTASFNRMSAQLQNQFDCLYQEELARRDAQIKALQSHINPHFLNNTLETINWQARMSGDVKASKMIEALSTVLDAALDRKGRPEVRLAEEMTYVNAYLYIVSQRFGKRLAVDIDLPGELMDCMVPRLILQPVIENAVEHGIGPGGAGRVALRGYVKDGFLVLEIENNGGLPPEDEAHIARLLSPDHDMAAEPSGNIGIANVNQRLRILYGPECGLAIFSGQGDLVTARLTVALPREEDGSRAPSPSEG
ncbi:sensor histidine kinase [Oscillibacter sp.]|uniref:sensor histidine kinase n=1 Tax=Oscillibacter sp. TaxID=1945593 RepID=UPI002D800092|nr:histidine kinase [Oscillibacter sp.]